MMRQKEAPPAGRTRRDSRDKQGKDRRGESASGGGLMRQSTIVRGVLLTALLVCAQWAPGEDRYILRAPVSTIAVSAGQHGLTLAVAPNAEGVCTATSSDARTPAQILTEVLADPAVLNIEIDQSISLPETAAGLQLNQSTAAILDAITPNKVVPYFGANVWSAYTGQAAATLIRLGSAQNLPATGAGIVAIIDTGVDPGQPALQGTLLPGYDFVRNLPGSASEWSDLDPGTTSILNQSAAAGSSRNVITVLSQSTAAILDQSTAAILDTTKVPGAFGHGTMVAGIVHLVAPTAQIMPLKAFRADGSANLSDIVRAIYYAVDNGARVINMSFSLHSFSLELMKAVNYATAHHVICVGSVGNGGIETLTYPAGFSNVIGVASTNGADQRSAFSNYGPALAHIAAPGENVVTLYPGGYYAVVSGTSFAAPFVAGGASLMIQVDLDVDQSEAAHAFSNGKKLTPDLGFGRLDLYEAVGSLKTMISVGLN